jgi:hypothetical protein
MKNLICARLFSFDVTAWPQALLFAAFYRPVYFCPFEKFVFIFFAAMSALAFLLSNR